MSIDPGMMDLAAEMARLRADRDENVRAFMSLTHQWADARKGWEEHRVKIEADRDAALRRAEEAERQLDRIFAFEGDWAVRAAELEREVERLRAMPAYGPEGRWTELRTERDALRRMLERVLDKYEDVYVLDRDLRAEARALLDRSRPPQAGDNEGET